MKKFRRMILVSLVILLLLPASAYAGEWKKDEDMNYNRIWYYYENGVPVRSAWKKIGGYWYRFMMSGALETNTWTEDGYFVNADGVWLPDWGKLSFAGLRSGSYEYVGDNYADTITLELYGSVDTGDGIGRADIEHYRNGYYGEGGNGTDTWYESYGDIYDLGAGSEDTPQNVYGFVWFPDTGNQYNIVPLEDLRIAVEQNDVWKLYSCVE